MALKTVIKHLLTRWGILSIDMQNVVEKDNAVLKFDGDDIVTDQSAEDVADAIEAEVSTADIIQPEFTGAVNQVNLEDLD